MLSKSRCVRVEFCTNAVKAIHTDSVWFVVKKQIFKKIRQIMLSGKLHVTRK